MKKYKVVILNRAKKDAKEARIWYDQQQKGLGTRFTADFIHTLLRIAENPTSFAIRYSLNRKANLKVFPYGIFFFIEVETGTVYITSVMHHSRKI